MGLHVGNGIAVIALWLGHENVTTPQIYQNSQELHQTGEKLQVA
jgi:site-specific recombinase XerD